MHTFIKLIILFLIATVLHWAFTAILGSWSVSMNFMLIFAIAICAYTKPEYGYPTAFFCGLFLDFFGVKLFGHNALLFTLCASCVYILEHRLDFETIAPQIVCVSGLSVFWAVSNWILLQIFAGFSAWNGWWPFLGGIALSALLAPCVFWVVGSLFERKVITY